ASMFGACTGSSPPGCSRARTAVGPLASSARTARPTGPVTSVTSNIAAPSQLKSRNFSVGDTLVGWPPRVNGFWSNLFVRQSQQLQAYNERRQGALTGFPARHGLGIGNA